MNFRADFCHIEDLLMFVENFWQIETVTLTEF